MFRPESGERFSLTRADLREWRRTLVESEGLFTSPNFGDAILMAVRVIPPE